MRALLLCNKSLDNCASSTEKVKSKLGELGIEITEDTDADADFIVTVGGDGTILHEAKTAVEKNLPILGVNSGNLGFLATVELDGLDQIKSLLLGKYETEEHMLLDVHINGEYIGSVLNEVSVMREYYNGIADITVSVDSFESFSYRADGLIVATPTGSSAYSFSAGGPIIEKTAEALMITPVCPHSLMNRSLIISPEREIKITASSRSRLVVLCDGMNIAPIERDTEITVKRSKKTLKMICFPENNYFSVIKKKLL